MPTYRIEQLATDLATILTGLLITGPLTLAGHSMGGMAALAYLGRPAATRPVQPRGLVLGGTAAGGVRATSLATATGFLPSPKHYNAHDALASITAKTVVVSGGTDLLTPASHSRDMTAAIADAIH
jgi:pimeloyl-ACP methyl ester carboxylesterase